MLMEMRDKRTKQALVGYFYGYGYRWIRTKDDMTVQDLWPQSDPIRKQLLGWGSNANGFFSPKDEDVPLKVWLKEYSPAEAE